MIAWCPRAAVHLLMPIQALQNYKWRGARALVFLHEKAMRDLVSTWRRARAAQVKLPPSDNPSYASLETMLCHALKAGRSFMTWLCEKLELPDPGIDEAPDPSRVEAEADRYVEHLLARWRVPLADVEAKRFEAIYKNRGGQDTSLGAWMEHAVMHPMRHQFQLLELMENR